MKIIIRTENASLNATLQDSTAARDFYAQLPMSLQLEDYDAHEKIAYLPQKLDISGKPDGVAAEKGDITYYAPWGNLAIFYKPFRYSAGLVHLGRIDGDLSALLVGGKIDVVIEKAE